MHGKSDTQGFAIDLPRQIFMLQFSPEGERQLINCPIVYPTTFIKGKIFYAKSRTGEARVERNNDYLKLFVPAGLVVLPVRDDPAIAGVISLLFSLPAGSPFYIQWLPDVNGNPVSRDPLPPDAHRRQQKFRYLDAIP